MKYDEFLNWLQDKNGMGLRSARDVVSRTKRILLITKQACIDEMTMGKLTESNDFCECSMCIKSQLKRAVTLYLEFVQG